MNNESEEQPEGPDNQPLEQRILAFLERPDFRPCKPRFIANQLDLDSDQRVIMRRLVKRLVREGRLVWGARHLLHRPGSADRKPTETKRRVTRPVPAESETADTKQSAPATTETAASAETPRPSSKRSKDTQAGAGTPGKPPVPRKDEVIGVYRRASAGYGFVSPDGSTAGDRSMDVFVPAGNALDAVDRDRVRVLVRRGRVGPRLKFTGTVVEVVERKRHRFVGTLVRRGKRDFVEIDGGEFDQPIAVGDASARSGQPGDKAVIEMLRFPSSEVAGEAVILELLGPRGKPGVDTQTIVWQFDLPGEFPEAALDDARRQVEQFAEVISPNRRDLTGDTIVTIDPATARDFDDAISLEPNPDGTWRLGVHIADVSHFVPAGSSLDDEALSRGNSVYLPDRVIPMLPETISNGLASLQPERLRYTMTVHMTVDREGRVLDTEWCRGAIRSAHRFNYEEIDEYLADDAPWRERLTPAVFGLVRNMHTLAMTMRRRRMKRGSIDLTLPEVTIDLDENGAVSGAHVELNTESHQLIEEFMLAANEAVAQKLADLGHHVLRRIHERPSERRLNDLRDFIEHLGIPCEGLDDRFEIKRIVELARELPERQAIHMAVLRSMQKAVYSPKDEGHYALGSKAYCHFTSPIRRYPDLVTHRMIGALLDQQSPRADFDYLTQVGIRCSETEVRAEQAERELIKLKLINYLAERIGLEMEAVITGVESWGLFVQGIELPAEGLIPIDHLPYDQYTHDPAARTISGRKQAHQFRLGDHLRIVVEVADPDRRQLTFGLVSLEARAARGASPASSRSPGKSSRGQEGRGERTRMSDSTQSGRGRSSRGATTRRDDHSRNPDDRRSREGRDSRRSFPEQGSPGRGPRGESTGRGPRGESTGRGPRGESSSRGTRGDSSSRGPRGENSARGPRGESTGRGPRGESTGRGPRGESSSRGTRGDSSSRGPRGENSARGPRGESTGRGPRGESTGRDSTDRRGRPEADRQDSRRAPDGNQRPNRKSPGDRNGKRNRD